MLSDSRTVWWNISYQLTIFQTISCSLKCKLRPNFNYAYCPTNRQPCNTKFFFDIFSLLTTDWDFIQFIEPKTRSTKTNAKLIHNNVYCFFRTIFRLAIPAFFRFTDVISYKKQYTLLWISFAVVFGLLVFGSLYFGWLDLFSRDPTFTTSRIFVHGFCR